MGQPPSWSTPSPRNYPTFLTFFLAPSPDFQGARDGFLRGGLRLGVPAQFMRYWESGIEESRILKAISWLFRQSWIPRWATTSTAVFFCRRSVPLLTQHFCPSNLNSSLVLQLIVPRQQLLATPVDGASSAYSCYWSQHDHQQQSTLKKRMRASSTLR